MLERCLVVEEEEEGEGLVVAELDLDLGIAPGQELEPAQGREVDRPVLAAEVLEAEAERHADLDQRIAAALEIGHAEAQAALQVDVGFVVALEEHVAQAVNLETHVDRFEVAHRELEDRLHGQFRTEPDAGDRDVGHRQYEVTDIGLRGRPAQTHADAAVQIDRHAHAEC